MALFGASPERGELDRREVWDEDDAIDVLGEAVRIMVDGITVDATQLADEREAPLWNLVNCFHAQIARLDGAVDRITPEIRDLERAQDGTEVRAHELEMLTDRARNLGDHRDAFETLRDTAADAYRVPDSTEPAAWPARAGWSCARTILSSTRKALTRSPFFAYCTRHSCGPGNKEAMLICRGQGPCTMPHPRAHPCAHGGGGRPYVWACPLSPVAVACSCDKGCPAHLRNGGKLTENARAS